MATDRTVDIGEVIARAGVGRYQMLVIALLSMLMVVEGFEMQAMSYAAPDLLNDWGTTRTALGPVFSASLLGYLAGALTMSPFSDRMGRKAAIVAGVLIFGVFTLAAGFAQTVLPLGICRFLAGVGLGAAIPAGIALAAEYVPARRRATVISILFFGYSCGAGLGGFLAAWIMSDFGGWRSIFYVGGVAPLLLAVGLLMFLPESARFLALKGGRAGDVAKIVGRILPAERFTAGDNFVVAREAVVKGQIGALFRDGRAAMTAVLWVSVICSLLGHHFLTSWIPTIFQDAGHATTAGVRIGAWFLLGGALGSLFIGPLIDRKGLAGLGITFLAATPLVALIGLVVTDAPPTLTVLLVFLAGTFVLGGQVGLSAAAGTIYPTAIRTTGTGWALGIGRIGSVAGPIVGGVLLDTGMSHTSIFLFSAVPLLCAATGVFTLMMVLRRMRQAGTDEAAPAEVVAQSS